MATNAEMNTDTRSDAQTETTLRWRVHLLQRHPERSPALLLVLFIGGASVWLLFERLLPVITSIVLLLGAAAEYLLPTSYSISSLGITANSRTTQSMLAWKDVQRCLSDPAGIIVTPLRTASRLDRFRGILLRYARAGETGDMESVLAAIARYAPALSLPSRQAFAGTDRAAETADVAAVSPRGRY